VSPVQPTEPSQATNPGIPGDLWTAQPRLMLVTDRRLTEGRALEDVVCLAVAGGVDTVQVREKDLDDDALLQLVHTLVRAVEGRARLLVNDRPALAAVAGVGLHLPEAAPPPARSPHRIAGQRPQARPWPLLGRSVHGVDAARRALAEGVDYLIAGTIMASESKPGAPLLGLDGLRRVVAAAHPTPVLAIGGLHATHVPAVLATGAAGIAVQRAILRAPDPATAAHALRTAVERASGARKDP
jgi:thiamine-phosphate diphosphorylase